MPDLDTQHRISDLADAMSVAVGACIQGELRQKRHISACCATIDTVHLSMYKWNIPVQASSCREDMP